MAGVQEPEKKGKKKRKRNSTEGHQAQLTAETGKQNQPPSQQKAAENITETAADVLDVGPNANSPAPTEQKKQSRSARRKQLKRRFRRLGVAPPPQAPPSSSPHPLESANPVPSSDPSAAQTNPEAQSPNPSGSHPPPKRLKTQSGKLKAQKNNDGHVYFDESGSESELAEEDHATDTDRAGRSGLHAEVQESSQNCSGKQPAASKQQNAAKEAAPNGLSAGATLEVVSSLIVARLCWLKQAFAVACLCSWKLMCIPCIFCHQLCFFLLASGLRLLVTAEAVRKRRYHSSRVIVALTDHSSDESHNFQP